MNEREDDRSFHAFMKRNQPEAPLRPSDELDRLLRRIEPDHRPKYVRASRVIRGWAVIAAMVIAVIGALKLSDQRGAGRVPPLARQSAELNAFVVSSADEAVYGDSPENEFIFNELN